nr:hypothetical protein [Lachnospiraceae bacterium]
GLTSLQLRTAATKCRCRRVEKPPKWLCVIAHNQFRQDKPEFFLKNRKDRGSEITTIDGQQDYQSE